MPSEEDATHDETEMIEGTVDFTTLRESDINQVVSEYGFSGSEWDAAIGFDSDLIRTEMTLVCTVMIVCISLIGPTRISQDPITETGLFPRDLSVILGLTL
jgi:hypothetical protein